MYRKYPRPEKSWHLVEIGVILFLMTLTLESMGLLHGTSFTFAKIFLMLTFPYWAIQAFLRKDPWLLLLPFKSRTSLAIGATFVANLFSLIHLTSTEYLGGAFLRYFFLYLTVILIAQVIRQSKKTLHAMLICFAVAAAPNSVAGMGELLTHKQILKARMSGTAESMQLRASLGGARSELAGGKGGRRVVGFSQGAGEHAIHSISYAAMAAVIPFIVRHRLARMAAVLLVFLNMVNVVATGSRTGIIGLLLSIGVFLYFIEMRRKWLIVLAGVLGFVIAATLFDLPLARILQRTGAAKGTVEIRIQQFQVAFNMIQKYPLFGVGPGNYITEYHRYHQDYPWHDKVVLPGPLHNAILNQAAEGGLVGLVFFLALLAVVFLKLYLVRKRSPDPHLRATAVAVMAAFTGWVAGLLFYPGFFDEQGWILMGITIGLWNIHVLTLKTGIDEQGNAAS
ncbi:MAG: O-antigen ligase family protein [bacterium]